MHTEIRDGWPLLTVETEASQGVLKGVLPWLVRWARCAGTRDFLPVQNIFLLTVHYFSSFVPIAQLAGQQSCRVACPFNMCLWVCRCVKSVIRDSRQEWELTTCEALLPFMCQIQVTPQSKELARGPPRVISALSFIGVVHIGASAAACPNLIWFG